jgi:hypothetical protein
MVLFEGMPYPISIVYIKTAGDREVVSLPFSEALAILVDVQYDYRASQSTSSEKGAPHYVVKGCADDGVPKTYIVSKGDLISRLQSDIYDDSSKKITDIAIQPEDERLIGDVEALIAT